ncbi:neuronal acetylcholine receptor subunit alpha-9-II-like isoform X2 [Ptychodera flava]|uniref:neuronal acetylcholine receptor subunit alpha-9-II-like isoform X2 n=1 Tax=Ptychodera flava TaxID=63121 RepID=UPI003969C637
MMDTKEVLEIALHSLQRIEHSLKEIEANSKQTDSDVWHTKRADNQKEVIWEEQWHPRLVFTNAISVDKMETKHHLYEDKDSDDGIPYAAMNFRLKATFKEPMELYDFPFDCQDLTIRIMSDWPDTDVQFKKNMSIKDSIRIDTFTGAQEWDLHKHVISQAVDEDRELTGSHRKYPMYHITAHVQRRIGFYLWNVALIMFLIMCMTFASFSVDPFEPADRLSVTLTLLLTSVAFKFVVSQSLPTISYLTILDKYILFCMTFQCIMVVQNATASVYTDVKDAKLFDLICITCLACLVAVAHLSFGITIALKYKASQKEMKAANQKYQELCQQINKTWTENMAKRQQRDEEKTVKYEINYVENDHHEIKRKKAKRSRVRPNESKDGKGLGRLKDPDRRRHDGDHSESTERQSKSQSAEYNIPI